MPHTVDLSQIKSRADAIGISLKVLAHEAGVDPTTAYRGAKGATDYKRSTALRLLEPLERRERQALIHLANLYPVLAVKAANGEVDGDDPRQADIEDIIRRASA